jgi:hypothetical protein
MPWKPRPDLSADEAGPLSQREEGEVLRRLIWTAKVFDRKTGKVERDRYQFQRNSPLLIWED